MYVIRGINIKKMRYVWAITLVITSLMITSAVNIATPASETESSINVKKLDLEPQTLEMAVTGEVPLEHMTMSLDTHPAFEYPGDQLHPAFGRTETGIHMASYRDNDEGEIIWTFSTDDGETYDPGYYYPAVYGGDYPSIKLWSGTRFFGTFVTDLYDSGGSLSYIFECSNPADFETYDMNFWDWSTPHEFHDMIDADIACCDSQNEHEWGVSSYVMSTDLEGGVTNAPVIVFANPDDPNYALLGYYSEGNCSHTDVDIDREEDMSYAIFDQDPSLTNEWRLLCRRLNFADPFGGPDNLYAITSDGNLKFPAISVNNGNIVILAETDEYGDKDIICFYGDDIMSLQTSFVVDSGDDEMFPDVRHLENDIYVCTFVMSETLYKSVSEDGGATWSNPEEVYETVEEYKTSDICDFAAMAMFEVDNGVDIDIHLENELDVWQVPVPILDIISISGGLGVTATIKNIGDGPATDVAWNIRVTGGILNRIDVNESDIVLSLAAGAEFEAKTGIFLGFGKIEITVSVTCDEESSDEETADGRQIIIFTWI